MYRSDYRTCGFVLSEQRVYGRSLRSSERNSSWCSKGAPSHRRWTPQPYPPRLVKAKQRISHPLHKTKSQRVGHPEPSQPFKDVPPAAIWNRVFKLIDTQGVASYHSGSRFIRAVQEVDPYCPNYSE